jgi:hypothetical protein
MCAAPLRLLVQAAYRSMRFHDGPTLATVLEALARLDEHPSNPQAVAAFASEALPEHNARDIARTFSALVQFGCEDELTRMHYVKNYTRRHIEETRYGRGDSAWVPHLLLRTLKKLGDDTLILVLAEGWNAGNLKSDLLEQNLVTTSEIERGHFESSFDAAELDHEGSSTSCSACACECLVMLFSAAKATLYSFPRPCALTEWLISVIALEGKEGKGGTVSSLAKVCDTLANFSKTSRATSSITAVRRAFASAIVDQLDCMNRNSERQVLFLSDPIASLVIFVFLCGCRCAQEQKEIEEPVVDKWRASAAYIRAALTEGTPQLASPVLCAFVVALASHGSESQNETELASALKLLQAAAVSELHGRVSQWPRHHGVGLSNLRALLPVLTALLEHDQISLLLVLRRGEWPSGPVREKNDSTDLENFVMAGFDCVLRTVGALGVDAVDLTPADVVSLLTLCSHLSVAVNKNLPRSPASQTPFFRALSEVLHGMHRLVLERVQAPLLFSRHNNKEFTGDEAVQAFGLAAALDPNNPHLVRLAQMVIDAAPRLSERSLVQLMLAMKHYPLRHTVLMHIFPALVQQLQSSTIATAFEVLRAVVNVAETFSNPQLDYAVLNFFNIHTMLCEPCEVPHDAFASLPVHSRHGNNCKDLTAAALRYPSVSPLVDFVTFAAHRRDKRLSLWDADTRDCTRPHQSFRLMEHQTSFISCRELVDLLPVLAAFDRVRCLSSEARHSLDDATDENLASPAKDQWCASTFRQFWKELSPHRDSLREVWLSLTGKLVLFITTSLVEHERSIQESQSPRGARSQTRFRENNNFTIEKPHVATLTSALMQFAFIHRKEGALPSSVRTSITRNVLRWILENAPHQSPMECKMIKTNKLYAEWRARRQAAAETENAPGPPEHNKDKREEQFCSMVALAFRWLAGEPAASHNLLLIEETAVPAVCFYFTTKASKTSVAALETFLDDRHEVINAFVLVANMISSRDVREPVSAATSAALEGLAASVHALLDALRISLTSSVSSTESVVSIIGACCELLCFAAVSRAASNHHPSVLLHLMPPFPLGSGDMVIADLNTTSGCWASCLRRLERLALLCLTHLTSVPSAHSSVLRNICHRLSIVCPEVRNNPLISMLETGSK